MVEKSNINVRSDIRPGDLGRVLSLHGIVYSKELALDITFEGYVAGTLARFAGPIDLTRERLWLAEVGEQLIGCIAIVKHSEEVAQLRWLVVAPDFRGQGIGRQFVAGAIAFAQAAGYRSVFLETLEELPAAATLYRLAGFELVKEETCRLWGQEVTDQRYELTFADGG